MPLHESSEDYWKRLGTLFEPPPVSRSVERLAQRLAALHGDMRVSEDRTGAISVHDAANLQVLRDELDALVSSEKARPAGSTAAPRA